MGGSLSQGNVTEYAEFNIYADPESYNIVLHSGIPCTMIGLDVTMKATFKDEWMSKFKEIDTCESKLCEKFMRYVQKACQFEGDGKTHIHDPFALAALVHPEYFTFQKYPLSIDCDDKRGMVKIEKGNINCKVAMDIKEDLVWDWFWNSLKGEKI